MEGYLAEIRLFAGNFSPRNWAYCNGQLFAINSNQALFSLVGTTYGGDGRTTFGLPDLRGRVPMSSGTGPGLTPRLLGQRFGAEQHFQSIGELAGHTHTASLTGASTAVTINTVDGTGDEDDPDGQYLAGITGGYAAGPPDGTLNAAAATGTTTGSVTVGMTGASQGMNIIQPSLVLNYIICISGIFPSRN